MSELPPGDATTACDRLNELKDIKELRLSSFSILSEFRQETIESLTFKAYQGNDYKCYHGGFETIVDSYDGSNVELLLYVKEPLNMIFKFSYR